MASKPTRKATAPSHRTMMPLEKARRSPRWESWRGRNSSRARTLARTGNPLKAVLAARTRISPVTVATR